MENRVHEVHVWTAESRSVGDCEHFAMYLTNYAEGGY